MILLYDHFYIVNIVQLVPGLLLCSFNKALNWMELIWIYFAHPPLGYRYNNFEHDPLSACDCKPPYSAENAIASRSDLMPAKGRYPFSALGHRLHGATDMKVRRKKIRCCIALCNWPKNLAIYGQLFKKYEKITLFLEEKKCNEYKNMYYR